MFERYCADEVIDEAVVHRMDECFCLAFDVDFDVMEECRKVTFYSASEVKANDCTDDETMEDNNVSY